MALVVRTVGAWRVIPPSMASCYAARVLCEVEPTRKALSHSGNTSSNLPRRATGLSISSSVGEGVLRCQATTLTAVRETTADDVSEREVEIMRRLEDSRATLRDCFGGAECVSNEECRPTVAESHAQRRVYHGRRGGGDWYPGLTTPKLMIEDDTPIVGNKSEMIASFEAAGCNAKMIASLAVRAWRKLGDADTAEALYMKALQLAPEDSSIQAGYAEFLWQCDV